MPTSELLTILAALAAVLLLAFGSARAIRWTGMTGFALRPARPNPLALEAVLSVDPKRRLVLVSCRGRNALVLTGPGGDTFLGWEGDPACVNPSPQAPVQ